MVSGVLGLFDVAGKEFTPGRSGLEVIKFEFILKLKIKCYGCLLADTCPQAANHCTLF